MKKETWLPGEIYKNRKLVFSLAKNDFKTKYAVINVSDLNMFEDGTVVTPALLKEIGFVKKQYDGIKVLGEGTLTKKLTIQANKFSKTAIEKIEESGSKIEVI